MMGPATADAAALSAVKRRRKTRRELTVLQLLLLVRYYCFVVRQRHTFLTAYSKLVIIYRISKWS